MTPDDKATKTIEELQYWHEDSQKHVREGLEKIHQLESDKREILEILKLSPCHCNQANDYECYRCGTLKKHAPQQSDRDKEKKS